MSQTTAYIYVTNENIIIDGLIKLTPTIKTFGISEQIIAKPFLEKLNSIGAKQYKVNTTLFGYTIFFETEAEKKEFIHDLKARLPDIIIQDEPLSLM